MDQYIIHKDMDRTIEWFENVLGWYGAVNARDDHGIGIFGGIAPIPDEITKKEKLTYLGFSLLCGEPMVRVVAYFVKNRYLSASRHSQC